MFRVFSMVTSNVSGNFLISRWEVENEDYRLSIAQIFILNVAHGNSENVDLEDVIRDRDW